MAKYAEYLYDPIENIVFSRHPEPVELVTRAEMGDYFDDAYRFWQRHCAPRKIYIMVDYANLTTNLSEIEFYSDQVKRVLRECAITIVRYDGSMIQRMAGRMTAIRLHTPSNTYATREEAVRVIRGLKKGAVKLREETR